MRKKLKLPLLLLVNLMLLACEYPLHLYYYEELVATVIRVELINYDNPDAKTIRGTENLLPFDFDKMEIIATLREERFDGFFKEFSQFNFWEFSEHLDSPQGRSLRFVYRNGDFEVVCCKAVYSGRFDSNGNIIGDRYSGAYNANTGNDKWITDIINRYFDL